MIPHLELGVFIEIATQFITGRFLFDPFHRDLSSYRFEDFFWTGSGDGEEIDYPWLKKGSPTVFKTETIYSTIYVDKPSTTSVLRNTTKCSIDCQPTTTEKNIEEQTISPTPTQIPETTTSDEDEVFEVDQQFWIITVLKARDGKDPVIIDLKKSLAKLYKTAFQRHQEKHLGLRNRRKRQTGDKPVKVYIHNLERNKTDEDTEIQVLYHVSVSGNPIEAVTAVQDMTLLSDEEVQNELGYPFLIKAERNNHKNKTSHLYFSFQLI